MSWVRWSLAIGLIVVLVSFAAGTEDTGVRNNGQTWSCGSVLTFDYGSPRGHGSLDDRPAAVVAKCRPVHAMRVAGVWSGIGLGTLAVLVGWTALREREDAEPSQESVSM